MAAATPRPHRFRRTEYDRMAEAGIFESDLRLELIEGEIVEMTPQSTRHFTAVRLIEEALRAAFGAGYDVRTQGPLAVDEQSEPEPDLAVVSGAPRDYRDEHPRTALLVVEVAESSLCFDRIRKKRLYARSGIPEYWILDIKGGRLEVHRHCQGDDYAEKQTLGSGDTLSLLAATNARVAVADLLP